MSENKNYLVPITFLGLLFFSCGFALGINSLLVPVLQESLSVPSAGAYLLIGATFIPFLIFGYPAGQLVKLIGYKRTIAVAFLMFAISFGILIFSAKQESFVLFLVASFCCGTANAFLQTAINPYITILGPIDSAAKRISIMGICNKLAWPVSPLFITLVAGEHFTITQLDKPFYIILAMFLGLGVLSLMAPLPEVKAAGEDEGEESPRHPVPRQVDHDARSIDLIRQEPAEEHDVFRRIRQDVQKLLDAQDLRGEKDADRLDLLLPRDRLDQSARRRQCVGLSVKRQGDDARRGEEREGHGGSRRIRQIVLAAPHSSIGEATFRRKSHNLCVREDLPRRGLEIPHRIDGKLRREKTHEKIRDALHGSGDLFCLLQTESKIVFFVKQRRKLLQSVSFLSFR